MGIAQGIQLGAGIMRDIDKQKQYNIANKQQEQQASAEAEKARKQELVTKIKIYADAASKAKTDEERQQIINGPYSKALEEFTGKPVKRYESGSKQLFKLKEQMREVAMSSDAPEIKKAKMEGLEAIYERDFPKEATDDFKEVQERTKNKASAIGRMLSSGIDEQGTPLSAEKVNGLRRTVLEMSNDKKLGPLFQSTFLDEMGKGQKGMEPTGDVKNRMLAETNPAVRRALEASDAQKRERSQNQVVRANPVTGEPELVNKTTGAITPSTRQIPITESSSGEDLIASISRTRRQLLITPEQITTGTGLKSNIFSALNSMLAITPVGAMTGEVFPKTSEAKSAIRSFNQMVKNDLTINARNPVSELNTIKGFLPDPDISIQDPETNVTKVINLAKRFESDIIKFQNEIQRGGISDKRKKELLDKVSSRMGILSQMPTIVDLKTHVGRPASIAEGQRMSDQELIDYPEELLTDETRAIAIQRASRMQGGI